MQKMRKNSRSQLRNSARGKSVIMGASACHSFPYGDHTHKKARPNSVLTSGGRDEQLTGFSVPDRMSASAFLHSLSSLSRSATRDVRLPIHTLAVFFSTPRCCRVGARARSTRMADRRCCAAMACRRGRPTTCVVRRATAARIDSSLGRGDAAAGDSALASARLKLGRLRVGASVG